MAFVDHGEFEAMKTLVGRRAPCCDKDQFRAKMTVSTSLFALLNFVVVTRMRKMALSLPMAVASGPAGPVLAGPVFRVIFGTAHAQIMKFSHLRSCTGQ